MTIVFVANYNIDAVQPPSVSELSQQWLQAPFEQNHAHSYSTSSSYEKVDLFVIGLQEVLHFDGKDDIEGAPKTNPEDWAAALLQAVNWHPDSTYGHLNPFLLVRKVLFSSQMLIVLARRNLVESGLVDIETTTFKLHDGTMTGKKGICGVEFSLKHGNNKSTFALMTSHFQAYAEKLDERIWDAKQVVDLKWPSGKSTTQHDFCILTGDLNFRIVLPIEEVKSLIAENKLDELLKHDELFQHSRKLGVLEESIHSGEHTEMVFKGWNESRIAFKPTYKYVNGTNNWDDSGKQRTPAWCDRILWYGPMQCSLYTSFPELLLSDHKPILAILEF